MANDRYGSFLQMMGLLQGAYSTAGQLKNTADSIAVNRYQTEQQARQFDVNAEYAKESRDYTRGLTSKATDRTEQELLVDTEVAKNPYKFSKGWRRNSNGNIEPYAYEMTSEQQKLFANQNSGSTTQRPNSVIQSFQDPVTGDITNVYADGTVSKIKGDKSAQNADNALSNFIWMLNTASKGGFNFDPKTATRTYKTPIDATSVKQMIVGQWNPGIAPYGVLRNLTNKPVANQESISNVLENPTTNWWEG